MQDSTVMVAGALIALPLTALLSGLALRYARQRQLLDQPGHRRSHQVPTPRGGGIAIVITLLLALPLIRWGGAGLPVLLAFAFALVLVAGIGWLDDHHPQPVLRRLLVHLCAALILVLALLQADAHFGPVHAALLLGPGVFWLAGCVNAWNFMDGSNGLVTSQCLWLGLVLAAVFQFLLPHPAAAWSWFSLVLALACAGFLPFNFPRAVIFLGDVGSGALGLLCGFLLLLATWMDPSRIWLLLLLPSALLVDAGLTLCYRVAMGRRWYTAHREHLYQWLIRAGLSHARVALLYLGWNLLVVLPACMVILRWPPLAPWLALGVLLLAMLLWWRGKTVVRNGRMRGRHGHRTVGAEGRNR